MRLPRIFILAQLPSHLVRPPFWPMTTGGWVCRAAPACTRTPTSPHMCRPQHMCSPMRQLPGQLMFLQWKSAGTGGQACGHNTPTYSPRGKEGMKENPKITKNPDAALHLLLNNISMFLRSELGIPHSNKASNPRCMGVLSQH